MDPMTIMAIASMALGAAKAANDQKNYKNQMEFEARLAPWSPWSKRPVQMPQQPNALNTLMQSGASAAQMYAIGGKNPGDAAAPTAQNSPNFSAANFDVTQMNPPQFYRGNPYANPEYWFGRK